MDIEQQLLDLAMTLGSDYFGIADLTTAKDEILEQGGAEIAAYPRSISIGIALFHPIVDQLPQRHCRHDSRQIARGHNRQVDATADHRDHHRQ